MKTLAKTKNTKVWASENQTCRPGGSSRKKVGSHFNSADELEVHTPSLREQPSLTEEKKDPSAQNRHKRSPSEEVDIDDYIIIDHRNEVTTDAWFCSKRNLVKGKLTICLTQLKFIPDEIQPETSNLS